MQNLAQSGRLLEKIFANSKPCGWYKIVTDLKSWLTDPLWQLYSYWNSFTGLGDDSKLPFQIRLLNAASKQQASLGKDQSKQTTAQKAQNFLQFQAGGSTSGNGQPFRFLPGSTDTAGASSMLKLSEYMYRDKSHTINTTNAHNKSKLGFSIDEIMRQWFVRLPW